MVRVHDVKQTKEILDMYYGICKEHSRVCYKQSICPSRGSGTKNEESSEGSSAATTLTPTPCSYTRLYRLDLRVGVLVVEVARVRVAAETRAPRRRDLLFFHRFPVDAGEERVCFDLLLSGPPCLHFLRIGGPRAEAGSRIALKKKRDKIARLQREVRLVLTRRDGSHRES